MMRDKSLPALPEAFRKLLIKAFGGSASNVFKGMATLALGSSIAKLIGIAAIPILTRLYSPEDFGVLAVFTALISILAPLLTLRYVLSLPLPRHDGMALNLLALSVGLMLLTLTLVAIILWAFGESILTAVSMDVLVPWWWLVILGLFATACYEMLTLWATRKRSYSVISKTSVWQSFTGSFAKIALGLLALKPFGLLFGQVIAQGGGVGVLLKDFNNDFKRNWRHVRWSRMRKGAWQHRGFPFFRVPSQFFLIAAQQMPLLFVATFYGVAVAGQLAVAKMLVSMPVKFISGSLTKAAYGELASIGKNNIIEMRAIFNDVTKKLFILSSVASAAVFIMA